MTGPEHYREAERLLEFAREADAEPETSWTFDQAIQSAQVHATLALAAATALGTADQQNTDDYNAWFRAASEHPRAAQRRREAERAEQAEWDSIDSNAYQARIEAGGAS